MTTPNSQQSVNIMTHDEIDRMEAGPDMDALVAERVMKHKIIRTPHLYPQIHEDTWPDRSRGGILVPTTRPIANYSTDITAAWEVVNKLCSNEEWDEHPISLKKGIFEAGDCHPSIELIKNYAHKNYWTCHLHDYWVTAYGESPALAICRCALKAVIAHINHP